MGKALSTPHIITLIYAHQINGLLVKTQIHHLISHTAEHHPANIAVKHKQRSVDYHSLSACITQAAAGYQQLGLERSERVAIYLPKLIETVTACFATSYADGAMVPVNPLLKPEQVKYILNDCNARILVTSSQKAAQLKEVFAQCHDLHTLIIVGESSLNFEPPPHLTLITWSDFTRLTDTTPHNQNIDSDMAAILYTSGSTGKPKGVALSHRNIITGANSVASYLGNRQSDKILALLPFSFDYGFNQLTSAFVSGAQVHLLDYLLPREVLNLITQEQITGLAAVPTLWNQLTQLKWHQEIKQCLRYITNSGGAMPAATLQTLREQLPETDIVLMYGLTEAFRSTYLPPDQLDKKPGSIGKAIPNAEVMVLREDGSPCAAGEPGELVHRGALVALGYWNNPQKTAKRFRPIPSHQRGHLPETAVWSGDKVYRDEEGYLYFIGREDEMIKTSGYRVSPTEVEEVLCESTLVEQGVVFGVPHPLLGEAILAVVTLREESEPKLLERYCKQHLPAFMQPKIVIKTTPLPHNPNGKIDRTGIFREYQAYYLAE